MSESTELKRTKTRVKATDVQLGQYICDLRCNWWRHSMYRNSFTVDTAEILAEIHAFGPSHEVVVLETTEVENEQHKPKQGPLEKPELLTTQAPAAPTGSTQTFTGPPLKPLCLESEIDKAKRLVSRAKRAISDAMAEGRTGEIKNLLEIEDIAGEMVASTARNPAALQTLAMLKTSDDYTFTHCVAVGSFMIMLARTLGMDERAVRIAGTAGLLHDVGKAGLDMPILNKPGKLTDEEFRHVRLHPVIGEHLLRDSGFTDEAALDVVRHHHERPDGKGYPDKLTGADVSSLARMGAVTDVYDAVTSRRVYHQAMAPTAGLQMLLKNSGGQFDARIVHAFIKTVGLYPNGSLVTLRSNRLAVVKEQCQTNMKTPVVRVLFSLNSGMPLLPYDLDLSRSSDAIESFTTPEEHGFNMSQILAALGV